MNARTRLAIPGFGALALIVAMLTVTGAAWGGLGQESAARNGRSRIATPAAGTPTTTTLGKHDGSLGDADTQHACTLLNQSEIESQFGGPVGEATPLYPYCQWLVGDDAFVAVTIYRLPIDEARDFHAVLFDTSGLGDDGGYIATTRAVFFGRNGVTYSILWQKVGDFTTVETEKLSALAHAVLGRV